MYPLILGGTCRNYLEHSVGGLPFHNPFAFWGGIHFQSGCGRGLLLQPQLGVAGAQAAMTAAPAAITTAFAAASFSSFRILHIGTKQSIGFHAHTCFEKEKTARN